MEAEVKVVRFVSSKNVLAVFWCVLSAILIKVDWGSLFRASFDKKKA